MTSDDYPYLTELTVPDRLRIAAYEDRNHGVPTVHIRDILDAAEELENLIDWEIGTDLPDSVHIYGV